MPQRIGAPGELVTIPGVELARTGRWSTSTGVFDFTRADFEDAVRAQSDLEVWDSPVKIGHTDPRFQTSLEDLDGDPALGWVENLRVRDDADGRSTLLGDLANVPAALARIIPAAYKRRSVELAFGVRTPSGRTYRAAVIGLALLGVQAPAVAGLADVLGMYSGDTTFQLAAASADSTRALLTVDAPVSVEDRLAELERLVRAGSPSPIPSPAPASRHTGADDPSGGSTVALTDDRIREIREMLERGDQQAALTALQQADPAPAAPPAPVAPAAPVAAVPPVAPVAPVAPAAPPAPVAPVAGDPAAPVAPAAPAPVAPVVPIAPAAPAAPAVLPAELVAAAAAAGLTLMDGAAATQITAVLERERVRSREETLVAAARTGRLTPDVLPTWREALDRDFVANAALLNQLPAVFPTFELGHAEGVANAGAGDGADDAAWDAFYQSLGA